MNPPTTPLDKPVPSALQGPPPRVVLAETPGHQSGPSAPPRRGLKVLTYNISEAAPSVLAPSGFSPTEAIRAIVASLQPDIISFQECPTAEWARENFGGGYINARGGPQASPFSCRSHCGFTSLLIARSLEPTVTKAGFVGPALRAEFTTPFWPGSIGVIACHLAPFGKNEARRGVELEAVTSQCSDAGTLLVLGDMNMRNQEPAGPLPAGLTDAWEACGGPKEIKFTWHMGVNTYFNNLHGARIRFDRILFRGPWSPSGLRLVGDEAFKERGREWFLSDHFGLLCDMLPSQTGEQEGIRTGAPTANERRDS